jgi:hypothetical protein
MWHGIKSFPHAHNAVLYYVFVGVHRLCTKLLRLFHRSAIYTEHNDEMSAQTENFHLMSKWSCSEWKESKDILGAVEMNVWDSHLQLVCK